MTPRPGSSLSGGPPAPTAERVPGSGLEWACRLLWGRSDAVKARRGGGRPAGHRPAESYLVLPRPSNPRVLVPLGSPPAASAALARNHDATSRKSQVAKALLGAGLRIGLTQRLLPGRLEVSVAEDLSGDALARVLLSEHLRQVFGRRDIETAVILGTARLNRKPVLQVLSPDGEVLGYVKAAWNDLTRSLVRNEAAILELLGSSPRNSFAAPELLHHGPWNDLELIAASPLPNATRPDQGHIFEAPLTVITEIAQLQGVSRHRLAESPYWADVQARLAAREAAQAGATDVLAPIVRFIEARHGATALRFGTWHGDFTPWNMARLDDGVYVWDWERAAPAPVGLDLLHFLFQSVCRFDGRNPAEAVEICRERTPSLLPLLDVAATSDDALWCLYRMELLFRYDEARLAGALERKSRIHSGILELFKDEMEAV